MKNEVLLLIIIGFVALICIFTLIANIEQIHNNRKKYKNAKKREKNQEEQISNLLDDIIDISKTEANLIVKNAKYEIRKEIKDELIKELKVEINNLPVENKNEVVAEMPQIDKVESNIDENSYEGILKELKELKNSINVTQQVPQVQYVPYQPYPAYPAYPPYAPMQQYNSVPVQEVKQVVKEEPVKVQTNSIKLADDSVLFSSKKDMTLDEKYEELSKEEQSYFDEISRYAEEQENVKLIENNKYKEYKIGNNKVVKLEIKRDFVFASFVFIDSDLREYSRENKVAIKQKATPVKIATPQDVQFAKDSIDLVIKQIEDDIIAKKELQKEKRRQKNLEKKLNTKA